MRLLVVLALALAATSANGHQQPGTDPPTDEDLSIQLLTHAIETALSTTDRAAWLALLSPNADRTAAAEFFDSMVPQGVTRAVARARDRQPLAGALPGEGYRLVIEILIETGARARIATWRVDVRRARGSDERQPWRVIAQEKLSSIDGLHNLDLHPAKQFTASNLLLKSVDLELRLVSGDVFVAETAEGVTALVLLGEGTMTFAPTPTEERGQVRLYSGNDIIETAFSAAYIRLNPFEFEQQTRSQPLTPVARDGRAFRRAQALFDEMVGKSFSLDLQDLSRDTWSLLPQIGDFLAEIRTRRFGTLTFARSTSEAEDVTLFSRERKRNISVYASEMKLSSRGRFFNEDDLVEYDVLHYDIDATFAPAREWITGRARVRLRIKAYALGALTLKLAEDFSVAAVTSDQLGPLLFLRVRNQNSFVVNLPTPMARDMELTLTIAYSGRLPAQSIDQETIGVAAQQRSSDDMPLIAAEPRFLYSNRNHWYPQGQVSDYATATLRLSIPAEYTIVASGLLSVVEPVVSRGNEPPQMRYVFRAPQPIRYLAAVISRFNRVDASTVALDIVGPPPTNAALKAPYPPVGTRNTATLTVEANRRQEQRGRELLPTAAEIMRFYAATVGDVPYDAMTIAMVEDHLPGGHSPGYFAVINNPLPASPFVWRNDPAAFSNFPEFFVAHEIAHQWWGQAVGWKNYHEQWLSEGFAQYFAAMFARERRGEPAFRDVLRQLRRFALDHSDQGAVYLGYRLGHIKGDSRVFRALVYNKGAAVLHMLRRLLGDEAFFRGVRRFYSENRFRKAGTEDLQQAMERESNRDLDRFFERWIYESGIPRLRYSTSIDGQDVVVRFEQITAASEGPLYDVPVTVSIHTTDGVVEEVVPVSEASVERRIPTSGSVKTVEINADGAAIAVFDRR